MLLRLSHRLLLILMFRWLLAATVMCLDGLQELEKVDRLAESDQFSKLARTLSPKGVTEAVKKAPEKLKLGNDNFLGTGVKRKSVAGAYGSTAAVGVGAAAISYQTVNLVTKNRDADRKQQKDIQMKEAICRSLRQHRQSQEEPPRIPSRPLYFPRYRYPNRFNYQAVPEAAPLPTVSGWYKRALSDAALNTIEDYNKIIGGTEAMVGASIAVTSAHQSKQRSLAAASTFDCEDLNTPVAGAPPVVAPYTPP